MEKQSKIKKYKETPIVIQCHFKPITPDFEEESCQYCAYGEQDIDTFPCAKCHTRH